MFVSAKLFQTSPRFVIKTGAQPSPAPKRNSQIRVDSLTFPTNIRQGWKGLPGTNTLAYYENSKIADVKSFITLGLGLVGSELRQ
jgi:hypothetical protein